MGPVSLRVSVPSYKIQITGPDHIKAIFFPQEFKNGTRGEELSRKKDDALTTTRMRAHPRDLHM